ncbi:MAG: fumarylacetoacetate hydrolase family protein [Smithellaceae bacterium]|jgi:2-keto-4-pentenoate hydratase/2-oxohepta-3-ene-1,7-dioic acid hydratase in catechol pathway
MKYSKRNETGADMKIIRFVSGRKKVLFGVYNPKHPTFAKIIEGDILGSYKITSKEAEIKKLLPPIIPVNILALGINYKKHGDETAMSYPDQPILFLKATTSIVGHDGPIILPAAGPDSVDYEAELAVIIGKKAKNVSPDRAMDYVMGYTCANDVSARDWQFDKQKGQWARGKSFDTFCPLGPWIVTKEEIDDPNNLGIRCIINGETVQEARTSEMIFNVQNIVSNLSQSMTLLPGTVILTGTPDGVGFTRQPPLFLKAGDLVSVKIEKIGTLTNRVVREDSNINMDDILV